MTQIKARLKCLNMMTQIKARPKCPSLMTNKGSELPFLSNAFFLKIRHRAYKCDDGDQKVKQSYL